MVCSTPQILVNVYDVCTLLLYHIEWFHYPRNPLSVFLPFIPVYPQPLATTDLFAVFIFLPFTRYHLIGIVKYLVFKTDIVISLSNMYLSVFHVFLWFDSSFHFGAGQYSIIQMDNSLQTLSFSGGHLGSFQVLAIMSKAAINIHVQGLRCCQSFHFVFLFRYCVCYSGSFSSLHKLQNQFVDIHKITY